MSLSKKASGSYATGRRFYSEEDVKEFIHEIIKKFEGMEIVSGNVIKFEINQLAGNKLITKADEDKE